MTETCQTCIYWRRWASTTQLPKPHIGNCRRFPPQVLNGKRNEKGESQYVARFPITNDTEWCGEHAGLIQ